MIRRIHRGSNSWSFYNLYFFRKKIENDILLAIKHIKEVIKKNAAFEKIEQFTKRNKMQGENQNVTYNLSEQPESDDVVLMSHIL